MRHQSTTFWALRPASFALLVAGVTALLFACGDALRQDELDCEEAVSQLQHCCPNFDSSRISCVYVDNSADGCNATPPTLPDISESQSACIRKQSCQQLITSGACSRAAQVETTQSEICQ